MRIYTKAIQIIVLFFLVVQISASTLRVDNVDSLIVNIHTLNDGDTLLVTSGTYTVTLDLAPDGLYVAGKDFTPYKDVTILGEGRQNSIIDFDGSYGFMAAWCDNLIFKDLTIRNAKINGGIYVFEGSISLDGVTITDCESIAHGPKTVGNGGAICVDVNSTIKSISNSIFSNNVAQDNGGAIAVMGKGSDYKTINPLVDRCQFFNNSANTSGGAVYVFSFYRPFSYYRNVFFNNSNSTTLYLNGPSQVNFKNNTVVNNQSAGVTLGTALKDRFYFDNNVVANNAGIDCVGKSAASNHFRGWYNVVGTSSKVEYDGYFNDIISGNRQFYSVHNDSLMLTTYGAGLLAGRVPSSKMMTADIYGNSWSGVGDVGAIKVPLGDSISVWYGRNADFTEASNWKGSVPNSMTTEKIIISNCLTSHYPELYKGSSVNVPNADLYIGVTGAMKLQGSLIVDTLYLESQNGGTAQFINSGTLTASAGLSEKFVETDLCAPIYFPDTATVIGSVLPDAIYNTNYCVQSFNEADLSYTSLLATDTFHQDQGYWVQSFKNQTMTFPLPEKPKEDFNLQHTDRVLASEEGWNVIGNPYGAPLISEHMMANAGNAAQVASAVYSFSDGHFKAYVDSVGDVEAKVVMPYKAFYLKALSGASVFKLDTGDVAIMESDDISEVTLKSEMLKVSLSDNFSDIVDNTFIRFKGTSSDAFDNASDAYKLDCMFGLGSEYLYTMIPGADDVYSINTRSIAKEEIKSMPLMLMAQPSVISASPKRTLTFDMSDDTELEYLLHDTETDSSQSVILTDGYKYVFNTGKDSAYLNHRFSLQIFEDTIPNGVLSVENKTAKGYYLNQRQSVKSIEEATVESTMLESVAFLDNPDTIFYEQQWVDTVYYDSISYQINYHDSTAIDSAISDTIRVLGTYEYVVREVSRVNTRFTTQDTVYLDTVPDLMRTNKYIKNDFSLVSSNIEVEAQYAVEVISLDGGLSLRFVNGATATVELYNLSGVMLRRIEVSQEGDLRNLESGIYVLNMYNADEHWSCKVLVK